MRRLDADETGDAYGPLAILMVGFTEAEVSQWTGILVNDLDGGIVKVISGKGSGGVGWMECPGSESCCPSATERMLEGTLGEALESEPGSFQPLKTKVPRAMVLSGMYNQEGELCCFCRPRDDTWIDPPTIPRLPPVQ